MEGGDIPAGRIRRTSAVAATIGGQGARVAGATALEALRRSSDSSARVERRHLEAAQKLVEVLGGMKGAAMKIGQLASFVELDFLPAEFRPLYQQALAQLRDNAPALAFDRVERVLREEWGGPVGRELAELEPEAAAAASVGQVHRGVLHDGRAVAVKVQYPGIEEALRADLSNLTVLAALAKAIAPGLDARAVAGEIRERVLEEMDYELEATNQRMFARAYRGHPFVHVPAVVTELSRRRVLVSEWVEGEDFEVVRGGTQRQRDQFGEVVFRFGFSSMYHLGAFNADPHPGNYKRLGDGRVAFLDFGSVKHVEARRLADMVALAEHAIARDGESFRRAAYDAGFLTDPERVPPDRLLAQAWALGGWYLEDRPVRIDARAVADAIASQADPRTGFYDVLRGVAPPADDVMGRRLEYGLVAILGQLGARANWHRIAREWWRGEPPATPLGEAEAQFWARRGHSRIARVRALQEAG